MRKGIKFYMNGPEHMIKLTAMSIYGKTFKLFFKVKGHMILNLVWSIEHTVKGVNMSFYMNPQTLGVDVTETDFKNKYNRITKFYHLGMVSNNLLNGGGGGVN